MYWRRLIALGVAFLVALVAIGGGVAFFAVLRTSHPKAYGLSLGAFLGAFFAFLFVRLGDALTIMYKRKEKHLGALVILQHRLTYLLVIVDDNIWLAEGFLKTVSTDVGHRGEVKASGNRLSPLPVDEDLPTDLTNLDLINDLLSFNVHLRKMNESMASITRQYDRAVAAVEGRAVSRDDLDVYRTNVSSVLQAMGILCQHLKGIHAQTIDLLTKTRLLSRASTLLGWIMRNVTQVHYPRNFDTEVSEERAKVLAELERSRQQSHQRLMMIEGTKGTTSEEASSSSTTQS